VDPGLSLPRVEFAQGLVGFWSLVDSGDRGTCYGIGCLRTFISNLWNSSVDVRVGHPMTLEEKTQVLSGRNFMLDHSSCIGYIGRMDSVILFNGLWITADSNRE